jgi:hypothetical protein
MVSCFLGASLGSALSSAVFASDGWSGVCVFGAATAAVTLVVWVATTLALRSSGAARLARGESG